MPTMQDLRINVAARVQCADDTIRPDILNPEMTQDNLIRLLDRLTAPADKNGLGYRVLITSLRRDHGNDANLGPHGHAHGFAVDLWPVDESEMQQFLQNCATNNRWVTKIGLGGSAQDFADKFDAGATVVFNDNSSDHVHLQTA